MANIFESNLPQPGQRATQSTHRKIELQSPADLTYIIANLSRAAREKLDQHLPPDATPAGEDAVRERVEWLVDEYIRNTFAAAKDNISINGMDTCEWEAELAHASEELEPYDTQLAQRIQALSSHIEHHILQLANLRRKAPRETAVRFTTAFERHSEACEKRVARERARATGEAERTDVGVGPVERAQEMRASWLKGNAELQDVNGGMAGTVEKMERARRAVEMVVVGEGGK